MSKLASTLEGEVTPERQLEAALLGVKISDKRLLVLRLAMNLEGQYFLRSCDNDSRLPGWFQRALFSKMPESAQDRVTSMSLSWKKLHLSKAKLKASSKTSTLLAGFAMVAMVEVQLDEKNDNPVPEGLLIAFAICTTLLVAVHMLALMISTCILPNVEAISNGASPLDVAAVLESPHEKMHYYIETAWAFSTVFGIFLFLCEIAILCWVKFHNHRSAAVAATILLIPVVVILVAFTIHFYRKLVMHKYERSENEIRELEEAVVQLETDRLNGGHH